MLIILHAIAEDASLQTSLWTIMTFLLCTIDAQFSTLTDLPQRLWMARLARYMALYKSYILLLLLIVYFYFSQTLLPSARVHTQSDVCASPSYWLLSPGFQPFVHRLLGNFLDFPLDVFLLADSRVFYYGELLCPSPGLVCCLLCSLHVYSPSNFFVPDHINSACSCSFSENLIF